MRQREEIQEVLWKMKDRRSYFVSRISLTVLSAVLLVLSFPNFNLYILAWIGLIPLLFAIQNERPARAFWLSYLTGVLFFSFTIYWLIHVTLPGMIIMVLYLALYFGLFGLISNYGLRVTGYGLLFFLPALWVSLEFLRSHFLSGFGWALLSHSQTSALPVIQIADHTGAYGVTFLIVMVNAAIFLTIRNFRNKVYGIIPIAIAFIALFLSLAYGAYRLNNIFTGEKLRVAIVQGNIPQEEKWDYDFRAYISDKYAALTKEVSLQAPDLIIWPETSVPGYLETDIELLNRIERVAKESKIPLLVGAPREEGISEEKYYNSAFLFDKDGQILGHYDKLHLVPFGEYVPFKSALAFVEKFAPLPIGDFSEGRDYTVFKFLIERKAAGKDVNLRLKKFIKLSCLICFEDIFPNLARGFVKRGAQLLVNITNDAWFKDSSAAYQHAQSSIYRAVENRTNVVRAANTGLSCFIDQKGRVSAS